MRSYGLEPDAELALWVPDPPADGDAAYALVRVGTFRGRDLPGEGFVETVATAEMPPKLRDHMRATASD